MNRERMKSHAAYSYSRGPIRSEPWKLTQSERHPIKSHRSAGPYLSVQSARFSLPSAWIVPRMNARERETIGESIILCYFESMGGAPETAQKETPPKKELARTSSWQRLKVIEMNRSFPSGRLLMS